MTDVLGDTTNSRLNTLVHDIVHNSEGKNEICMSSDVEKAMYALRKFLLLMYIPIRSPRAKERKVVHMIEQLYEYFIHHSDKLPEEFLELIRQGKQRNVRSVILLRA